MKRIHRGVLLTSVVTLLPMAVGLFLWDRLPDRIATHFNIRWEPDGYSGKAFTVFGIPLFLLAIHLLCNFFVRMDTRSRNVGKTMNRLVLWIVPAVSLFVSATIYPTAVGANIDGTFLSMLFTGVLFLVLGNYLPKCRQNSTIGIRVPWTLMDEEVWDRTHRLAGPLWVIAGAVIFLDAFVKRWIAVVMIAALVLAVGVPVVCSAYWYYQKRGSREDRA